MASQWLHLASCLPSVRRAPLFTSDVLWHHLPPDECGCSGLVMSCILIMKKKWLKACSACAETFGSKST